MLGKTRSCTFGEMKGRGRRTPVQGGRGARAHICGFLSAGSQLRTREQALREETSQSKTQFMKE